MEINIKDQDWQEILQRKDIVKLNSHEYAFFKHPNSQTIFNILWDHENNLLTIGKDSWDNYNENEVRGDQIFNYLVTNYSPESKHFLALYKITYNSERNAIKLELIKYNDVYMEKTELHYSN